ncbi:amidohydrolase [bacterium]|nr:amidohydrolase [bacterium]
MRMNMIIAAGAAVMAVTIFFHGCSEKKSRADLILKNGVIFTGTEDGIVEAIAIKKDRIIAAGPFNEIDKLITEKTRIIDLDGKFACAGFNDAHLHLLSGGLSMLEVDLTGASSLREIRRRIANKIRTLGPGAWILGRGWDQNLLPGKKWPTRRVLDMVAPDVPIYLRRICGHAALVNTKALRISHITKDTPDPPGGEIVHDPKTGEPIGILKDSAMELVSQYIPGPSKEQKIKAVKRALDEFRRFGITSVSENTSADMFSMYSDLEKQGKLTCRISEMVPVETGFDKCEKLRKKYRGPYVRFGLLKAFADGSLGARSAALFEPYSDNPSTKGLIQYSQNEINTLVAEADKRGFQMGIHAIGTRANYMILNAYEFAQKKNGKRDSRHRIEHAQILIQDGIPRFKELGVIASMQPFHCIDDMHWAEKFIGPRRCRYAYAWRSLMSNGANVAFGTDWPIAPLNPLVSIYAAVTRMDTTGYPAGGWFPDQRLTVKEALLNYTRTSAYAEFCEKEKGVLKKGMLADIVVLDKNILKVFPEDILKTKVVYTIVGGKIVYEKGK